MRVRARERERERVCVNVPERQWVCERDSVSIHILKSLCVRNCSTNMQLFDITNSHACAIHFCVLQLPDT